MTETESGYIVYSPATGRFFTSDNVYTTSPFHAYVFCTLEHARSVARADDLILPAVRTLKIDYNNPVK